MPKPPLQNSSQQAQVALPLVRKIGIAQPFNWLARGWHDIRQCGWVSLAHGVVMAAIGGVMLLVAHDRFWLLAGAFSGFLLVAPVLATSLYALSRALEQGEPTGLGVILKTWLNWHDRQFNKWDDGYWTLVQFGVLLALAGTAWVLISATLITLMAPAPITNPMAFIEHVVLARDGFLFELWLALGGVLVAPIFASTVITIPLLLDRQISLKSAIVASWQVVLENPLPMALWGALIMSLTLLGFGLALFGLVILVPLLGHASWHAYRDLLDVSAVPRWEKR
jgi:uncharacterized membrane protein